MTEKPDSISPAERIAAADLEAFCRAALAAAGADGATAAAATRAMLHGSRLGVDSHGVRLLPHYVAAIEGGRVNGRPSMRFAGELAAVATLDADHAHGALAAYAAMERAMALAERAGIGAVSIRNASHFGPAGAYPFVAAEAGFIGLTVCNSDSFVRLHEGAERLHGTNPIAVAAPAEPGRPWLLDMATSAIPYNRVQLYRSLGTPLPEGVASDASGHDTRDAAAVEMLAPLGGAFGFKGAGLAGVAEILSAVLGGMPLSPEIPSMNGPDWATPRRVSAFVLAIRPTAFVDAATFAAGMARYLAAIRGSAAVEGGTVMAPGDREWAEAERRAAHGIPIDPATAEAFTALSARLGIPRPATFRG